MELCFVPAGNYVQFIQAYSRESGTRLQKWRGRNRQRDWQRDRPPQWRSQILPSASARASACRRRQAALRSLGLIRRRTASSVGGSRWSSERQCAKSRAFKFGFSCEKPSAPASVPSPKIRHKHEPAPATIEAAGRLALCASPFDTPPNAPSPPAKPPLFYDGNIVLSGGWASLNGDFSVISFRGKEPKKALRISGN